MVTKEKIEWPSIFYVHLYNVFYFSNFKIFTIYFSTKMSKLLDEIFHCNMEHILMQEDTF